MKFVLASFAFFLSGTAAAADGPALAGIPFDFILFALVLLGVALFHNYTLKVAVGGLIVITLYKLAFTGFKNGAGWVGFSGHLFHEWVILANLLGLLLGFALLSKHFEDSKIPAMLPKYLPGDWKGGFVLLVERGDRRADLLAAPLVGRLPVGRLGVQRDRHLARLADTSDHFCSSVVLCWVPCVRFEESNLDGDRQRGPS